MTGISASVPAPSASGGDRPLVSVITVVRNGADTIERCLRSIGEQDFDNFEHVVIDGASSDGTVEIIERHKARIAYFHSRADRNAVEGFNAGIDHSRGQWLLFINADDRLANATVLSRAAPYLREHAEADVLLCQVLKEIAGTSPPSFSGPHGHPFRWSEMLRRNTLHHQAAFTRRTFVERVGHFNAAYRVAFDYDMFLRGGKDIVVAFAPVVLSIMDAGGLSSNVRRVLEEYRDVRIATGAVSPARAWSRYVAGRVRSAGGRLYHPVLAWWLNRAGGARAGVGTNMHSSDEGGERS